MTETRDNNKSFAHHPLFTMGFFLNKLRKHWNKKKIWRAFYPKRRFWKKTNQLICQTQYWTSEIRRSCWICKYLLSASQILQRCKVQKIFCVKRIEINLFFVFSFRKAGSKTTVMNIIRASAANLFLITLRVCLVFSNWLAHLKWPY